VAEPIRVLQWSTGNVGRAAIGMILDHPDLTLAGVYAASPDKEGRDAGELAGRAACGVAVTTSIEAALATGADVVLYAPLPSAQVGDDPDADVHVIADLLRRGFDVVTTVGFVHPKSYGAEVMAELTQACAEGGTTLHGTGVNPGFMAELLPLTLSPLCGELHSVLVREVSVFDRYPSTEVVMGLMGMGRTPDAFEAAGARYRRWLTGLFAESALLVADGCGVELTSLEVEDEVVLAEGSFDIAAGHIAAGTVAAQRWVWEGMVDDTPFVRLEAVYRAHPSVAPEWGEPGGLVELKGRPSVRLELGHRWIGNGLAATAAHAVHAIPAVVAARPGIATFLDLPLITCRTVKPGSGARPGV
jgi:hypothetical protein